MIKFKNNIVTFIVAIMVLFSSFLLFACDFGAEDESEKENQESEINFCYMDENLIVDDMSYKLYDASIQKIIPSTLGGVIDTDYYFMYIKIKITNDSNSSKNLYLSDFSLYTPSVKYYNPTGED